MQHSYLTFLKKYLLQEKKFIILVLTVTILQSLITICIPLTYKELIDRAFPNRNFNLFIQCVSIMISLFLLNCLFNIFKDYMMAKIVEKLSFTLKKELNNKLSRLSYSFFDSHKLSDILSRYNIEIDTVKQNCGYMTIQIFSNMVTTIFACSMILYFDWKLFLISASVIVIYITVNKYFGKKVKKYAEETMKSNEHSVNQIMETYNNILITKMYGAFHYVEHRFKNIYKKQYNNQMQLELAYSVNINISSILIHLLSGVIWIIGGIGIFMNKYSIGMIISLINYQNMLLGTARFFSEFNNSYQGALTAIERLQSIYDEVEERLGGGRPPEYINEITLDNICFSYGAEERAVLIEASCTIHKGQITAFVGPSGCGKSTLTKLLLGLYQPQRGTILINNMNLANMDLCEYRERTAYIPQVSLFFNDSIVNNLNFGADVDYSVLERNCKIIDLYNEIMNLPEQWDTVLSSGGNNLSGGQKKRLDIVRALIKDADILIFDEPTASLDLERRDALLQLLQRIKCDKIIILITHNIEEAHYFDRIVSVKDGQLSECTAQEWRTKGIDIPVFQMDVSAP
ncbi:ABC transporter ATP-binding protein [Paenibacillus albidus]|uniref:ABC transporter ATP-binding protein n=1 Tax=Paenibacillus albidus TaxID=2041023 RepID=UPI001C181A38|nr:ABC transporter ATP-binding protein [Paenibacillus albidus]MBT2292014.1 ABC transporter ATP-binding protein [Paenibacillus albidus]